MKSLSEVSKGDDKSVSYRYCSSDTSFTTISSQVSTSDCCSDELPSYPCAETVNKTLNLSLGLGIDPLNPKLRYVCKILSDILSVFEWFIYALWLRIPLSFRHHITFVAWSIYFSIHRRIIGRRSGIHKDVSEEYHALTSIAWWARLFPMTIKRMRFSLNQIEVWTPPTGKAYISENINCQRTKAKGIFLQINEQPSERVIFWLYGGAYLSGDCQGNLGLAEMVARRTNCDVFLVEYRLLPENEYADCIEDGKNGYIYLINERKVDPKNVLMFGISSGAGIAVYIMQEFAKLQPSITPRGAVLMCPFVDYTEPKGSMVHYVKHDLIVTEAVYAIGIPFLEIKLGSHKDRVKASPVYRSFKGLPPLCVVASEHECCYDMNVQLVNNARREGVKVDFAIWKYLCHVFPVFHPMVPEAKEAMDVMINWINNNY